MLFQEKTDMILSKTKILGGVLLGMMSVGNLTAQSKHPNVVILMADDLGYGDLSYTGCPDIKTPHIDELAKKGVQFTNYYTSGAVCTPTRTALITGRYQARFKDMEGAFYMETTNVGLPQNEETIARAAQRKGYATGIVGKWHIGELPHMQPQNQGFDDFFGFLGGNIDYFVHCKKNREADLWHNGKPVTDEKYMTDLITEKSKEFILSQHKADKPFLLYVSYNAPHWPYQGPDDEPCKTDGSNWMKGTRAHMTTMIERMDDSVGEIMMQLKKLGIAENTLVIFTSDNGGDRLARNAPFSGKKGKLREGGIHVPLAIVWPKKINAGSVDRTPAITMDISKTIIHVIQTEFNAKIDGYNLLTSQQLRATRTLCWRNGHRHEQAARKGDWKYLREKKKGKYVEQLFNVEIDQAETIDLKNKYPERFSQLKNDFNEWAKEMPYEQKLFGFELQNYYKNKISNEE
ncbi:twin-arginine translocation pathway signal protein [Prolixibacteraceae bacterium JC049]|nr:twin-arginine translocation pathway signal protein [Prolixibacteraceae bacterium JC049]